MLDNVLHVYHFDLWIIIRKMTQHALEHMVVLVVNVQRGAQVVQNGLGEYNLREDA